MEATCTCPPTRHNMGAPDHNAAAIKWNVRSTQAVFASISCECRHADLHSAGHILLTWGRVTHNITDRQYRAAAWGRSYPPLQPRTPPHALIVHIGVPTHVDMLAHVSNHQHLGKELSFFSLLLLANTANRSETGIVMHGPRSVPVAKLITSPVRAAGLGRQSC